MNRVKLRILCSKCEREFESIGGLQTHSRIKHKEEYIEEKEILNKAEEKRLRKYGKKSRWSSQDLEQLALLDSNVSCIHLHDVKYLVRLIDLLGHSLSSIKAARNNPDYIRALKYLQSCDDNNIKGSDKMQSSNKLETTRNNEKQCQSTEEVDSTCGNKFAQNDFSDMSAVETCGVGKQVEECINSLQVSPPSDKLSSKDDKKNTEDPENIYTSQRYPDVLSTSQQCNTGSLNENSNVCKSPKSKNGSCISQCDSANDRKGTHSSALTAEYEIMRSKNIFSSKKYLNRGKYEEKNKVDISKERETSLSQPTSFQDHKDPVNIHGKEKLYSVLTKGTSKCDEDEVIEVSCDSASEDLESFDIKDECNSLIFSQSSEDRNEENNIAFLNESFSLLSPYRKDCLSACESHNIKDKCNTSIFTQSSKDRNEKNNIVFLNKSFSLLSPHQKDSLSTCEEVYQNSVLPLDTKHPIPSKSVLIEENWKNFKMMEMSEMHLQKNSAVGNKEFLEEVNTEKKLADMNSQENCVNYKDIFDSEENFLNLNIKEKNCKPLERHCKLKRTVELSGNREEVKDVPEKSLNVKNSSLSIHDDINFRTFITKRGKPRRLCFTEEKREVPLSGCDINQFNQEIKRMDCFSDCLGLKPLIEEHSNQLCLPSQDAEYIICEDSSKQNFTPSDMKSEKSVMNSTQNLIEDRESYISGQPIKKIVTSDKQSCSFVNSQANPEIAENKKVMGEEPERSKSKEANKKMEIERKSGHENAKKQLSNVGEEGQSHHQTINSTYLHQDGTTSFLSFNSSGNRNSKRTVHTGNCSLPHYRIASTSKTDCQPIENFNSTRVTPCKLKTGDNLDSNVTNQSLLPSRNNNTFKRNLNQLFGNDIHLDTFLTTAQNEVEMQKNLKKVGLLHEIKEKKIVKCCTPKKYLKKIPLCISFRPTKRRSITSQINDDLSMKYQNNCTEQYYLEGMLKEKSHMEEETFQTIQTNPCLTENNSVIIPEVEDVNQENNIHNANTCRSFEASSTKYDDQEMVGKITLPKCSKNSPLIKRKGSVFHGTNEENHKEESGATPVKCENEENIRNCETNSVNKVASSKINENILMVPETVEEENSIAEDKQDNRDLIVVRNKSIDVFGPNSSANGTKIKTSFTVNNVCKTEQKYFSESILQNNMNDAIVSMNKVNEENLKKNEVYVVSNHKSELCIPKTLHLLQQGITSSKDSEKKKLEMKGAKEFCHNPDLSEKSIGNKPTSGTTENHELLFKNQINSKFEEKLKIPVKNLKEITEKKKDVLIKRRVAKEIMKCKRKCSAQITANTFIDLEEKGNVKKGSVKKRKLNFAENTKKIHPAENYERSICVQRDMKKSEKNSHTSNPLCNNTPHETETKYVKENTCLLGTAKVDKITDAIDIDECQGEGTSHTVQNVKSKSHCTPRENHISTETKYKNVLKEIKSFKKLFYVNSKNIKRFYCYPEWKVHDNVINTVQRKSIKKNNGTFTEERSIKSKISTGGKLHKPGFVAGKPLKQKQFKLLKEKPKKLIAKYINDGNHMKNYMISKNECRNKTSELKYDFSKFPANRKANENVNSTLEGFKRISVSNTVPLEKCMKNGKLYKCGNKRQFISQNECKEGANKLKCSNILSSPTITQMCSNVDEAQQENKEPNISNKKILKNTVESKKSKRKSTSQTKCKENNSKLKCVRTLGAPVNSEKCVNVKEMPYVQRKGCVSSKQITKSIMESKESDRDRIKKKSISETESEVGASKLSYVNSLKSPTTSQKCSKVFETQDEKKEMNLSSKETSNIFMENKKFHKESHERKSTSETCKKDTSKLKSINNLQSPTAHQNCSNVSGTGQGENDTYVSQKKKSHNSVKKNCGDTIKRKLLSETDSKEECCILKCSNMESNDVSQKSSKFTESKVREKNMSMSDKTTCKKIVKSEKFNGCIERILSSDMDCTEDSLKLKCFPVYPSTIPKVLYTTYVLGHKVMPTSNKKIRKNTVENESVNGHNVEERLILKTSTTSKTHPSGKVFKSMNSDLLPKQDKDIYFSEASEHKIIKENKYDKDIVERKQANDLKLQGQMISKVTKEEVQKNKGKSKKNNLLRGVKERLISKSSTTSKTHTSGKVLKSMISDLFPEQNKNIVERKQANDLKFQTQMITKVFKEEVQKDKGKSKKNHQFKGYTCDKNCNHAHSSFPTCNKVSYSDNAGKTEVAGIGQNCEESIGSQYSRKKRKVQGGNDKKTQHMRWGKNLQNQCDKQNTREMNKRNTNAQWNKPDVHWKKVCKREGSIDLKRSELAFYDTNKKVFSKLANKESRKRLKNKVYSNKLSFKKNDMFVGALDNLHQNQVLSNHKEFGKKEQKENRDSNMIGRNKDKNVREVQKKYIVKVDDTTGNESNQFSQVNSLKKESESPFTLKQSLSNKKSKPSSVTQEENFHSELNIHNHKGCKVEGAQSNRALYYSLISLALTGIEKCNLFQKNNVAATEKGKRKTKKTKLNVS